MTLIFYSSSKFIKTKRNVLYFPPIRNFLCVNKWKVVEGQFHCGATISFEARMAHRWGWTSRCVELRQFRCYRISLWLTQGNIPSTLLVLFPFPFLLVPANRCSPHEPASPILIDFGLATSNRDRVSPFFSPWYPFSSIASQIALNLLNGPLYYALMSDALVSKFDLVSEISMSSFRVFHDSSTSKVMGFFAMIYRCISSYNYSIIQIWIL